MSLLEVIELSGVDTLIRVVTLFYMFKVCNMAVITGENMSLALMKIYKAWTEEK